MLRHAAARAADPSDFRLNVVERIDSDFWFQISDFAPVLSPAVCTTTGHAKNGCKWNIGMDLLADARLKNGGMKIM